MCKCGLGFRNIYATNHDNRAKRMYGSNCWRDRHTRQMPNSRQYRADQSTQNIELASLDRLVLIGDNKLHNTMYQILVSRLNNIHTWMYFWTPTKDFLRASNDEEYNIFFFTLAVSGHQDMRNSFCFLEAWNTFR